MVTFQVKDMSCGHCIGSITQAVLAIDPGAQVSVDLATHRVRVVPTTSDTTALGDAIRGVGYTPVLVDEETSRPEKSAPRRGCCCS